MVAVALELVAGIWIYWFMKSIGNSFNYGWAAGIIGSGVTRLIERAMS